MAIDMSYQGNSNSGAGSDGFEHGSQYLKGLSRDGIREGAAKLAASPLFQTKLGKLFPGKVIQPESKSSVAAILSYAGCGFQVQRQPYFRPTSELAEALAADTLDRDAIVAAIDGATSSRIAPIVRTDTGAEIGHASPDGYGMVQNLDGFAALQVMMDRGQVDPQSIQVLDGGSRIRINALIGATAISQLRGEKVVEDCDVLAMFARFQVDHSGAGSTSISLDIRRMICLNGMTTQERSKLFSISHTSKSEARVLEATAGLLNVTEAAMAEVSVLQKLALAAMSMDEFRTFRTEFLDDIRGPLGEEPTSRRKNDRERVEKALDHSFQHGEGNHGCSKGDAFNSVTDWLTARQERYEGSKDAAARFAKAWESSTIGGGAGHRRTALARLTR